RANVADTYESIISDYEYCVEHGLADSESVFVASSTVAKAFLAEALIMRQASGDMERVIQLADEIIGSGEFVLEATFADVFNPSNDYLPGRELIFSRALNTAALTEIPGRS